MAQLEPNLTLTLKHLATCGAVLSTEQQAVLDHSLPLKRAEAGVKTLLLWGKITTLNGKDFLIAEGYDYPTLQAGKISLQAKYFYSQDGVKWTDLLPIDADTATRCARIKGLLSGDPAKNYELQEKNPNVPAPPADAEAGDAEEPAPLIFQIPEVAVLRFRIDSINTSTSIVPAGALVADAASRIVPNRLFAGCQYPEKLEAYQHRFVPPGGPSLAKTDLRGAWAVQYDAFKRIALLRSLLWPGYHFYYNGHDLTYGAMYVGDGQRNDNLVFML